MTSNDLFFQGTAPWRIFSKQLKPSFFFKARFFSYTHKKDGNEEALGIILCVLNID